MEGAGICHSDLHIMDGEIPVLPGMPITLGHENAGRVAEVGAGVTRVAPGDPGVVFGGLGRRHCDLCVKGSEQLCETPGWPGLSDNEGGYAEYLLVKHEAYLVKLEGLEPKLGAPPQTPLPPARSSTSSARTRHSGSRAV